MKKKLIILSSIVNALVLVMSVSVFAYFQITSNEKTVNVNHNFTDNDIIEVDDFTDLYNYAKETKYNDNSDVTDLHKLASKNRTILAFLYYMCKGLFLCLDCYIVLDNFFIYRLILIICY